MTSTFWTPERDAQLRDGEASGLSAAQIARLLETTRNAVLCRSARLRGIVFKSEIERKQRHKLKAELAREERRACESRAISAMAADIGNDVPRNKAISKAHAAGATWRAIGCYLGITKQRAQQLGQISPERADAAELAKLDRAMNAAALAASPYGPGGAYPSLRTLRRERRMRGFR